MATISGGDKLKSALDKIAKKLDGGRVLRVGFLEGSQEPDGTSIPMIAAIQEFGSSKNRIPPRPFFRTMIQANSSTWAPGMAFQLKAKNYDIDAVLRVTGAVMQGQLRDSIINTYSPPLSPITVMLRGMKSQDQNLVVTGKTVGEAARRVAAGLTNYGASTKPLIEHGNLLNAVDFEIKK